jgi:hypothetical protein
VSTAWWLFFMTCGDHYTYQLDGPDAIFLGEGDLHDTSYDYMEVDTEFAPFMQHNFSDTQHCEYDLNIFPSRMMEDSYVQQACPLHNLVVCLHLLQWYLFSTTVSGASETR